MHIIILNLDYLRPSLGQTHWGDGSQLLAADPGGAAAGRLGLCVWHRHGRRRLSPVLPERGPRHRHWRRGVFPELAAPGLAVNVAADRLHQRPLRGAH